ncbi:MAG TPA: hypothetical protein VN580_09370 [Clostridia bacterium]|nr:hypothetical protein [Clostridia bacterium]
MDVNTFIGKSQQQIASYRVREALEYALSSAREAGYPQFKILCLHTVVEVCHYYAGDGEASRAWCFALLDWMDKNPGVITDIPSLREVMEDMYIKQCEIIADVAISYEEYFKYMEKIKSVRPHTSLQSSQVELIGSMQAEGQPWSANMLLLAARYAGANSNTGQSNTMYGSAASLYGLMLQNRRKLRLSRTDLKMSVTNYSASIGNLVAQADNYYKNISGRFEPNEYLFMIDKAIRVINESKRDIMEPDAGEEEIGYLTEQREALLNMAPISIKVTSPPAAMNIIENPELLDEIIGIQGPYAASAKLSPEGRKSGSFLSSVFSLVLAVSSWYFAFTLGQWWWYLCAAIFTLSAIGGFIGRNKSKRM